MSHVPVQETTWHGRDPILREAQVLLPPDPADARSRPTTPRRASRRRAATSVLGPALDAIAVAGAWLLITIGVMPVSPGRPTAPLMVAAAAAVAIVPWVPWRPRVGVLRTVETSSLITTSLLAGGWAAFVDVAMGLGLGPVRIAVGTTATLALLLLSRELARAVRRSLRAQGTLVNPALLIGSNGEAAGLHRLLCEHDDVGLDLVGRIGGAVVGDVALAEVPWLGTSEDLAAVIAERGVRDVLIATSELDTEELNEMARQLVATGVDVHLSSGLQGLGSHRLSLSPVALEPLLRLVPGRTPVWQRGVKRVVDVTVASVVLVASLPLIVVVALMIKLQDRGDILFRQDRVGKDGVPFTLLKFRTMVEGAEAQLAGLRAHNERDGGPLFKMDDDPRVTKLGRVMRQSSIDELPQLLNVIRGDMSLVGPRPALPSEVSAFSARLQQRSRVKPGITGLWQVEARDNPSFWSYERLDIYYVENWTIALDLAIFLATVPVVVSRAASGLWGGLGAMADRVRSAPRGGALPAWRRGQ